MRKIAYFTIFCMLLFAPCIKASAQIITTIAGSGPSWTGTGTDSGDGSPAVMARVILPTDAAVDRAGNIYIADLNKIRKIGPAGIITTFAGMDTAGYAGDGGQASAAILNNPIGITADGVGNVYIADHQNGRIRKVDPSGIITTIAGSGSIGGYSGDGGPATAATIEIGSITLDGYGNIYFAGSYRVRKINTSGIITSIAGTGGTSGYSGDGGPATLAQLGDAAGIAVDSSGNVYIADGYNNCIRKVDTAGIITTIAGTGTAGFAGDGGPANLALLHSPESIALDGLGNLYIGDVNNARVRKISASDTITTYAGYGMWGFSGDGGPAADAEFSLIGGLAVDGPGNLYIADFTNNRVRKVAPGTPDHAPRFTGGRSESLAACANAGAVSINTLLKVNDSDAAQTEVWSAVMAPAHGTLTAAYSMASTGGILTPVGLSYTPAAGYSGSDSFRVRVTDGFAADTTTVHVTVSPFPTPITGPAGVCPGTTITLGNTSPGGSWSSSNISAATVTTATGVVTGVTEGPVTITYTATVSCGVGYTTKAITVNPVPSFISGITSICAGTTTTLTDGIGGGTWSSGSATVATIGPSTGLVHGAAPGSTSITYTLPTGCQAAVSFAVNPLPAAIGGTAAVCAGGTTTLTEGGGGTWTSGNTAVATIGTTGVVTGVAFGTAAITYTLPTTCATTKTVTVNVVPAVITGTLAVCSGSAAALYDSTAGGAWSPASGSIATVNASGIVSGVSGGTAIITYTLGTGCSRNVTVTVSQLPALIGGVAPVCVGAARTLTESTSGGAWSATPGIIATIDTTGTVRGLSSGITIITYTVALPTTGGAGCLRTATVTVNPLPTVITGPAAVCVGAAITEADSMGGGAWASGTASVATITGSGVVTGAALGTTLITYTLPTGCAATKVVSVSLSPAAISGAARVCAGDTTRLSDATGGGTWSGGPAGIATVDAGTGLVTGGVAGGSTIITYSLGTGCQVSKAITVNPISQITGATGVCVGATTALHDATAGGTWTSGTITAATVNLTTGVASGAAPGTSLITYTTAAGCTASATVTVNLVPSGITGNLHTCVGATTALSDPAGGGTWVSSNLSVATVPIAIGTVTGVSPGTSVITYSLGSGCTVNATVTVNPSPSPISGAGIVCAGSTITLSDPGGGTWNSGSIAIATVTGAGILTGAAQGVATITYTPGTGCFATKSVTVNPRPSAITGTTNICAGSATTLSDTTAGGTWASSNTGVATVTPIAIGTGVAGGAGAGTATITYVLPTGCAATATVVVHPSPGAIFGNMNLCVGSATTLGDPTSGGTWSAATGGAATVNSGGVVTGVDLGTAAISYTVGGCPAIAIVTVNSLPPAITGDMNVCAGSATALSDAATGGAWSSLAGSGSVMVGATGVVTGVGAGTAIIDYTVSAGCDATAIVTVNALPSTPTITGGADNICKGATAVVTDVTAGGSWSTGDASTATVTTTGVVLGLTGGGVMISYTVIGTGCAAATALSVTAVPSITGITHICALGDTGHVYDAMPGGTWSSTLAPVSADGLVTGFGVGLATVTYTIASGCLSATQITVNPAPAAIGGISNLCTGTTMALSETTTGGVWSPASGSIATVSAAGVVSGVSAGVATISYTLPGTGCRATAVVSVDAHPSAISGSGNVCVGATAALGDTVSGGVWSSGSASIATVDVGTGVVTGVSAGVATISYSVVPGCTVTRVVTVYALPTAYTITGGGNYCSGTSGVHIGLSGADAGISYKLFRGTTLAGTITGPAIDFGLETIAGTYKVVAINTATTCGRNMPDSVTVTVTPSVVPAVNVVASPANTVCAGTAVTFTATPVNGGTPTYQWTVNGGSVGSGGASYGYTPADNDMVGVMMTSSAVCAVPATISDSVIMTVGTPVIPAVTINATPGTSVQPGESVTFTASVANGGTSSAYQWEINSNPVAGATELTFINSFNSTDTVTCVVSAGGVCNPEGSNSVLIVVSNVGVTAPPGLPRGEVVVLPNPNDGEFVVRGALGNSDEAVSLEITDMVGQVVYKNVVTVKGGKLNERISLNNVFANGMYLLSVRSVSVNEVLHIVIER